MFASREDQTAALEFVPGVVRLELDMIDVYCEITKSILTGKIAMADHNAQLIQANGASSNHTMTGSATIVRVAKSYLYLQDTKSKDQNDSPFLLFWNLQFPQKRHRESQDHQVGSDLYSCVGEPNRACR